MRDIWGWVKTYYYHQIVGNKHPLSIYFRYHPGARVLTHSHMGIYAGYGDMGVQLGCLLCVYNHGILTPISWVTEPPNYHILSGNQT